MKENSIEELKQMLEELYRTQKARLDVGADDLDIREEIAEVEEKIKKLQDETMEENSIKNERSSIKEDIERLKLCSNNQCDICGRYEKEECMLERNRCEQHILSDYKRVLKENTKYKNMYESEHKIHLLRNEQLDRKQNAITKCNELQTENEQLRTEMNNLQKENEKLKNQEATARKMNELLVQRYSSSVPIQKIKDKIEELNKKIDESIDNSEGGLDEDFVQEASELLAQKNAYKN